MIARFFSLWLLLLAGCAAPLQTHYYQLANSAFRQPENTPSRYLQVTMSDALNKPALWYQDSAHTVHPANHHLWAEKPADAIAQVLANHLNNKPSQAVYTIEQNQAKLPVLSIDIRRFQGSYHAQVLIEGNAHFYHADGKLVASRHFSVTQTQRAEGYPAMVHALDEALEKLSNQLIFNK